MFGYYSMKSSNIKRITLDRTSWLDAAIELLGRSGIAAVSIVQLANNLGVTRGSFYHHFNDREDLLQSMLSYWEKTWTVEVREEIRSLSVSPAEKLQALVHAIREHSAAVHDAPFRAWALNDPLARSYLLRVDEIRLNYIRDLFVEAGFSGIDAENRARLLLHYEMSDPAFFVPRDDETETRLVAERLQLLLRPNNDKPVINM
jgi:AcrR family transcriptional regulator